VRNHHNPIVDHHLLLRVVGANVRCSRKALGRTSTGKVSRPAEIGSHLFPGNVVTLLGHGRVEGRPVNGLRQGVVIGLDALIDLFSVCSGVVQSQDDLTFVDPELVRHRGDSARFAAPGMPQGAEDLPYIGSTGQGGAPSRRPGFEDDAGMLGGGQAFLDEPLDELGEGDLFLRGDGRPVFTEVVR
jgi:hypothetical protein